jgi:hypothetical protein
LEQIVFALGDSSGPPIAVESRVPGRRGSGGRLRVLIVDDERLIADTLTAILNEHDFEAMGCTAARRRWKQRGRCSRTWS